MVLGYCLGPGEIEINGVGGVLVVVDVEGTEMVMMVALACSRRTCITR